MYNSRMRKKRYRIKRGSAGIIIVLMVIVVCMVIVGVIVFGGDKEPNKTAEPTLSSTPTVPMELAEDLAVHPVDGVLPSVLNVRTSLMALRQEISSYTRTNAIKFGKGKDYTQIEGILTFAGNNYRNTFWYGTPSITEEKLTRVWEVKTGAIDSWTGSGWTGMPLLVKWPDATKQVMNMNDAAKNKSGLVEVIYPTLDGNIYFLDLETGSATRSKLNIGVPTKGTGSIDPRGYPMLYTGQGIDSVNGVKVPVYFRAINLIKGEVAWKFGGKDPFCYRAWQAYDSSAVINNDTLITGGENGVLYTTVLNTQYDEQAGTVSINPEGLVKYRYMMDGYADDSSANGSTSRWWGIENSIAAWRNYAFFTDNGGLLQCVDLNTMKLIYAVDVLDDSDTSIVIEEDIPNQTIYLYTANEVDKQSGALKAGYGDSYHRKINGLTGEIIWQKSWKSSVGNASSNGGTLTTPAIIGDLIVYAMDLTSVTLEDGSTTYGGRLVAYNRETGEVVWEHVQKSDYWSSPVAVTSTEGKRYIVQCDRGGTMTLFNADNGNVLTTVDLGSRIDATPSAFGNMIVVGTRGVGGSGETQKIIGIEIS